MMQCIAGKKGKEKTHIVFRFIQKNKTSLCISQCIPFTCIKAN